jgi:hypothetical protein
MRPPRTLTGIWLLLILLIGRSSIEPAGASAHIIHTESETSWYEKAGGSTGYEYAPLTAPNPIVQEMIDQVEEDTLYQYVGSLSGEWPVDIGGMPYTILTRNSYSGEPIQKSSEYLYEFYRDIGYPVIFQDFSIDKIPLRNVIAEMPGSLAPDEIFMITGHYDNAPSGPRAPGADDNASGTAAVMLAASILSQYEFGCTLRFTNFSGEEQGLVGSTASARQSFCERENIRGVINLDMIAWNTAGSPAEMELHVNKDIPGSVDIAHLYQDVIETYNIDLAPEIVFSSGSGSDHASYWAYDFPAILAIEDLDDFNPHYHKTTDRLDKLDIAYFSYIVKASLATLAHMSCLVDSGWGTVSGKIVDEYDGSAIPDATITFYQPEWGVSIKTISDEQGYYTRKIASTGYFVSADALGYSPMPIGLVIISPDDTNVQDIVLRPNGENAQFLPLVQDGTQNPACP